MAQPVSQEEFLRAVRSLMASCENLAIQNIALRHLVDALAVQCPYLPAVIRHLEATLDAPGDVLLATAAKDAQIDRMNTELRAQIARLKEIGVQG